MRGIKQNNDYQRMVKHYDKMPKSVLAAIALSLAFIAVEEESFDKANARIAEEWEALHANGIVPQKPIR